jgi:hypothetical protein
MKAAPHARAHAAEDSVEPPQHGSGRRIKAADEAPRADEVVLAMVDALADILEDERRCA